MNPENSERSQTYKRPHTVCFHLCEISRVGKSKETECRLIVALGWEAKGELESDC